MRRVLGTLLLMLLVTVVTFADNNILDKLKQIPEITDVQKLNVLGFNEYYQFWFRQPVDHNNPAAGTFNQKVLLGCKKINAPVVVELEGYTIHSMNACELAVLLQANQLIIEHRFFDKSVPEDKIPWEYLTIKQAADDQHQIITAIKKNIYPDSKWISTGVSKGGQTTVYHRYFYPQDVDVSVPYVAPLNLEYVDPRLGKFFEKVGSKDCRWNVLDFQTLCFKKMDELLPLMEKLTNRAGYTYKMAGGLKRAMELVILEYPFAFWQWGTSCGSIPLSDTPDIDEVFLHLTKVSSPQFFDDKSIISLQPFFYAALTETGMYDYNIKPFKKYMGEDQNITFSFAMPVGVEQKPFNEKQMKAINKWLQTDAEKILFIYGGSDPWSATAVDLKMNGKCRKYVRGDMDHKCRIAHFDPASKEDLIQTLKEWLR